jgi:hypothetical protein
MFSSNHTSNHKDSDLEIYYNKNFNASSLKRIIIFLINILKILK